MVVNTEASRCHGDYFIDSNGEGFFPCNSCEKGQHAVWQFEASICLTFHQSYSATGNPSALLSLTHEPPFVFWGAGWSFVLDDRLIYFPSRQAEPGGGGVFLFVYIMYHNIENSCKFRPGYLFTWIQYRRIFSRNSLPPLKKTIFSWFHSCLRTLCA